MLIQMLCCSSVSARCEVHYNPLCPTHCEEAKKICVNLENHSAGRSSQGSPTHKKVFLQKFDPKSEYLGEVVEIPFRVCGLKFGNIRYLNAGRDFGHFSLFK